MMRFKPTINYDRSVSRVKNTFGVGIYTTFIMAKTFHKDGIILGSIIRSLSSEDILSRSGIMNSDKCYIGFSGNITTIYSKTKRFNLKKTRYYIIEPPLNSSGVRDIF